MRSNLKQNDMKEFGILLKDIEISRECFYVQGKIKGRASTFFILGNKKIEDYKPFLKVDGVDVDFKYKVIKYIDRTLKNSKQYIDGKEINSVTYTDDAHEVFQFEIEEI